MSFGLRRVSALMIMRATVVMALMLPLVLAHVASAGSSDPVDEASSFQRAAAEHRIMLGTRLRRLDSGDDDDDDDQGERRDGARRIRSTSLCLHLPRPIPPLNGPNGGCCWHVVRLCVLWTA